MTEKRTSPKGVFMLLLTAFIWGTAFVAQSVGMERVEALTFNGIRTLLGALILIPYVIGRDLIKNRTLPVRQRMQWREKKKLLLPGCMMGLALFAAGNVQQFAFYYTTPGKIAFITALYMLFVPLFGLFFRRIPKWPVWISVALGVAGLYLLSVAGKGFSAINKGDLLALGCAVLFAVHILVIEHYSNVEDSVTLSLIQFLVAGGIALALAFIFETPKAENLRAAAFPLAYSGFLSCGLAYTFQIVGQKYTEPTLASILMCMESVFGVLSAAVLLKQGLTGFELAGCMVMFAAIILSQLSDRIASAKPAR